MEGVTWKCWLSRAHKIRNQLCSAVACPRPRPEVASAFHPSRARGALTKGAVTHAASLF